MMGRVASRSTALVAKAGCVFGAVTLTPLATRYGVSGSSGAPDGGGVALAAVLAWDVAAEVLLEAVVGSCVVVPGAAAEHPTISAKEAATAMAHAFRLAPTTYLEARARRGGP